MAETAPKRQEDKFLEFLDQIDGEAEATKGRVTRNWEDNIELLRGTGLWKGTRQPIFQVNLVSNQVERKVGKVTESKPTFSVNARVGNLAMMGSVLDQTCRGVLELNELPLVNERISKFGMTTGCGFAGIVWDRSANDGDGDIAIVCLDPRNVYVDPAVIEAKDIGKKARYVRIDRVMSLDEIRALNIGRGALVKADPRFSRYQHSNDQRRGVVSAALNIFPRVFRPKDPAKDGPIKRAVVKEYWIRDPDTKSWPGGRWIVRCQDLILSDKPNPYWDGEFPLEMIDWRMDLEHPWGSDEVKEIVKLNESENRLGDGIMRNALFNSQAWVIADLDAVDNESWGKITNEGGVIVKKRPTRDFRRDPPPALPGYMFQMLQALPQMADMLTGNTDGAQGRGANSPAQQVTDGLQTPGNPLARMIARRFESFISRVGQKVVSRIIQFYDADRMLSYYDLNGHLVNYLYQVSKMRSHDSGEPIDAALLRRLHSRFRFVVAPYSSMAMTKMQRAQVAIGLWQASAGRGYPFRRVLELADVGDPDVLIKEASQEQKDGLVPPPVPPAKR